MADAEKRSLTMADAQRNASPPVQVQEIPAVTSGDGNSDNTERFASYTVEKVNKLSSNDKIIVFMGPTGSGKSTIIEKLLEGRNRQLEKKPSLVGSHLTSFTKGVNIIRILEHSVHGNKLVLVDTPGFDDTNRSDMEILKVISKFLIKTYQKRVNLSGLVYLQRITDNRIAETLHRSFHVFTELCGTEAMKHVALVTTMWDEFEQEEGSRREKQVQDGLWGGAKDHAIQLRFENTKESAWKIVNGLLKDNAKSYGLKLDLQEEMAVKKKCLPNTKAAFALHTPLYSILAKQNASSSSSSLESDHELHTQQLIQNFQETQKEIQRVLDAMHSQPSIFARTIQGFFTFYQKIPRIIRTDKKDNEDPK